MSLSLDIKEVVIALEEGAIGATPAGGLELPANAGYDFQSLVPTLDPRFQAREQSGQNFTPTPGDLSGVLGGFTMNFEVAGASGGGVPPWSTLMRLAGYRFVNLKRWGAAANFTSGNGPIRHGELVDNGGQTARVFGDYQEGHPFIYTMDEDDSGLAAGTVTSQNTNVVLDITADTGRSYGWYPVSRTESKLVATAAVATVKGNAYQGATSGAVIVIEQASATDDVFFRRVSGTIAPGGEIFNRISGAGVATFTMSAAAPEYTLWPSASVRLNEDTNGFDYTALRGSVAFQLEAGRAVVGTFTGVGAVGGVSDVGLIGSGVSGSLSGPRWAGSASGWADNELAGQEPFSVEVVPCLQSLRMDTPITYGEKNCASAENVYVESLLGRRNGTGSITAAAAPHAEVAWIQSLIAGRVTRLRVPVGATFGNALEFRMPGIQFNGFTSGGQNGLLTRDLPFLLSGGVNGNVVNVGDIGGKGKDNELLLMLHHTN